VKTNGAMPLLSGGLALLALPLAAMLFALNVDTEERSATEAFTEALRLGGPWTYGVLACGVAFVVTSALGVSLFARDRPNALALPLGAALFTHGVATLGCVLGLRAALEAVRTAYWSDRTVIIIGSTGESLWPVALASLLISAVFLTLGLALVLGATELTRRVGLFLALGLELLGVWQLSVARSTLAEIRACAFVAYAAPSERLDAVVRGSELVRASGQLGVVALAGVVLLVIAALATLRSTPRALVAVVSAVLVPLAGLGGLRALAQPGTEARAIRMNGGLPRSLAAVPGPEVPDVRVFVSVGARYHNLDDAQEPLVRIVRGDRAQFALEERFSMRVLTDVLITLRSMGVHRVTLTGAQTVETPPDTPELLRATFSELHGFEVLLGPEGCPPEGCVAPDDGPIPLALEGQTSESFLKAASAADSKSRQLLLVFPNP
jgi:hypothetical protein